MKLLAQINLEECPYRKTKPDAVNHPIDGEALVVLLRTRKTDCDIYNAHPQGTAVTSATGHRNTEAPELSPYGV